MLTIDRLDTQGSRVSIRANAIVAGLLPETWYGYSSVRTRTYPAVAAIPTISSWKVRAYFSGHAWGSPGSEELVKEWEKKYKSLERKVGEIDTARQEAINQFDQFKLKMAEEQKQSKINHTFERELGAIKLDPSVNEFTIKGFKATISEKYAIDLEEDGNIFVKDRNSGERLKSKEKAGSFLNLSDVLLQEATAAGIIQKNPSAGQRVPRPGAPMMPQLESQSDKKIRGINPRFFAK